MAAEIRIRDFHFRVKTQDPREKQGNNRGNRDFESGNFVELCREALRARIGFCSNWPDHSIRFRPPTRVRECCDTWSGATMVVLTASNDLWNSPSEFNVLRLLPERKTENDTHPALETGTSRRSPITAKSRKLSPKKSTRSTLGSSVTPFTAIGLPSEKYRVISVSPDPVQKSSVCCDHSEP